MIVIVFLSQIKAEKYVSLTNFLLTYVSGYIINEMRIFFSFLFMKNELVYSSRLLIKGRTTAECGNVLFTVWSISVQHLRLLSLPD